MVNLAKQAKCTYSRYADDLTFSTNKRDFPASISIKEDENNWVAGKKLMREIEKTGFHLNTNKTSMQYKTARQVATGLIVNKKVNIKSEYYKNARAMCHRLFNAGEFYLDSDHPEEAGAIKQLEGMLGFVYQVKKYHESIKDGKRKYNPTATTQLYRKFLLYKHFYALEKPLILCEGKTDIIYLKCALKQLSERYSEFIDISHDKAKYKIRFFNFSTSIKDVFTTSSGTSGLDFLIECYEKMNALFKAPRKSYPVIILIDNDEGSKAIKNRLKINKDGPISDFYHFFDNLYVLIVPKKEGAIEDLFNDNTLNIKVNGKSFSRGKSLDNNTAFGKSVFADKVISAQQNDISFEGFREVLDGLREIIKHCENSKKSDTSIHEL